jgi:hypothetical protein
MLKAHDSKEVFPMTYAQRVALRVCVLLLVVAGALLAMVWHGGAGLAPAAAGNQTAVTFYGADTTKTVNAIKYIWPQAGPTCGIESTEAAVNYNDEVRGLGMRFRSTADQKAVAKNNQTSGASQWGYPKPINAYGGVTNISRDLGTDPRSIAYMEWNYTPSNTYYHDYIYRWQFANSSAPSFYSQVLQATTSMAQGLATWHEPLVAQINGGLHSVLVTGVYSYNDPRNYYPAQITSVVYRDPMAYYTVSRFEVSIGTWAGGHYSTPYGVYSLWSLYYGDRYSVGDSKNTSDPEPAVGIYVPTSSHPIHWYRGFTWIQRDNNWAKETWNPDWAYTSTGKKMTAP